MSNRSITRLRTFHDDFELAREKAGVAVNAPATVKPLPTKDQSIKKPETKKEEPSKILDERPLPAPGMPIMPPKPKPVPSTPVQPPTIPPKATPPPPKPEPKPETTPVKPITDSKPVRSLEEVTKSQLGISKFGKGPRGSILNDRPGVFDVTEAEETGMGSGGIITDTKRNRFRLFSAIIAGIKEWFTETEERIEKARAPKHTVTPAEKRASVITSAAERSALAPKDDYARVAKHLQSVPRTSKTKSDLSIKDEEVIKPAHWAYVDEDETTEEPTAAAEPTLVIPKGPTSPEPSEQPAIIEETEPTETQAGLGTEESVEPEPTPQTEEPVVESLEPIEEPASEPEEIGPEEEPPEPEEQYQEEPEPEAPPPRRWKPTPEPRSFTPSPVIAIVVVVLAVGLGVTTAFWIFGGTSETPVVTETTRPNTLIESSEQLPTPLTTNRLAFLRNILDTEPRTISEIAVVYPTVSVQGSTEMASINDTLSVLDWQAPSSFTRNIDSINFGLWKTSEPFMVLKISSFDIALSGILSWETNMSFDLAPLFGSPVSGTFDPNSRSATQIREPYFIDSVIDNHDVRVLRDELYKERIIYSFINKNTILITNSIESFRALAPYVR